MTTLRLTIGCRFACALAAGAILAIAHAAHAVDRLPADAPNPQVEAFVREQFDRLQSKDPQEIEDARRSLESPFDERQPPSMAFRLVYGSQVAIELGPLLRNNADNTTAAANALLVAGQCGTPQIVELLGEVLEGNRGNMSPALRTAAVAALHTVIRDANAGRIRREQGEQAVTFVAEALAKTDDPAFASTCMVALSATDRQQLHPKAAEELAVALPTLAASIRNEPELTDPERWEQVLQLGVQLIYVYILQAKGSGALDATLAKNAVEAGAQSLGFVVMRVEDVGGAVLADTNEGGRLVGLTERAENLMKLAGGSGFPGGLAAKLRQAIDEDDDQPFLDAAREAGRWIQNATGKAPDEFGL